MNLVEIKKEIPDAILDIRYATTNNFTGKIIYEKPFALLEPDALDTLKKAADEFRAQGLRIVVFDAWRPPEAQDRLREVCSDDKYVAETPRHASGRVIDMSLADLAGAYLDMGTDYDDFSNKAHADFVLEDPAQQQNRLTLGRVMANNGFKQYKYEWWDFELQV